MFTSDESIATELELYVLNESSLFDSFLKIVELLAKKQAKGTYSHDKALICWERWVLVGAKAYLSQFKMTRNVRYYFPKTIRKIAVERVAQYAFDEYIK
jgi:hypothetical protein